MSADTSPISPARFASALKDLSTGMLHLKVLEIRNSIAHLQFSNDQLKPFADGTATALSEETATAATTNEPDQDCVDAIRENEAVIDRMMERIALIRAEVEERGQSWTEFQSKDEVKDALQEPGDKVNGTANGHGDGEQASGAEAPHSAWSDGTFQTGVIRSGQVQMDNQPGRANTTGGTLSDEQLREAMEERMRNLGTEDDDDDDDEGGMHL